MFYLGWHMEYINTILSSLSNIHFTLYVHIIKFFNCNGRLTYFIENNLKIYSVHTGKNICFRILYLLKLCITFIIIISCKLHKHISYNSISQLHTIFLNKSYIEVYTKVNSYYHFQKDRYLSMRIASYNHCDVLYCF